MEIGTVKPLTESEEPLKLRLTMTLSGGSGKSGGNNGGDNGDDGGGDGRNIDSPGLSSETGNGDKAKVITWFLLMVVGMTFAGLISAYLMVSTNHAAEWKPFELPVEVWISTVLILLSSISFHLAKKSIYNDAIETGRRWLLVTTVLGAAFISSQLMVWLELSKRGLYMHGNPYAGFFYVLTAIHVVHVLGGIVALGSIVLSSWYGGGSEADRLKRRKLARAVGWYWDFIGAIWIVLFAMLAFWR